MKIREENLEGKKDDQNMHVISVDGVSVWCVKVPSKSRAKLRKLL